MSIEQSLIGCILQNNDILADIADIVTPLDFKEMNARDVYNFTLARWKNNEITDLVVISASLKGVDFKWVAESTMVPIISMAKSYAVKIAESAKVDRLRLGIDNILLDKDMSSDDILFKISNIAIDESSNDEDITDSVGCVGEFDDLLKSGGVQGLSTGYMFLDQLDIVLVRGDYWVIGADTSVGKTALALNIFCYLIASYECKICLISTEMTRRQIMSRIISYFTNIASITIFRGRCSRVDNERVKKCMDWLKTRLFFISEKTFEISKIENKVRSLNMKHDIDLFIVDYLQHCRSRRFKGRYDILTDVSNRCQELAKVTETTCLALSQISNEVAKNVKGRTKYKGSGDIDGDVDVGIVLEPGKDDTRKLRAHIKKNRHGAKGVFKLMFTKNYSKIEETI